MQNYCFYSIQKFNLDLYFCVQGCLLAIAVEKVQIVLCEIRLLWEKYPPNDKNREDIFKVAQQTLAFCKYYVITILTCVLSYDGPVIM